MTKTAADPFFATNIELVTAARNGAAVTPSDAADLPYVTSNLIVTIGSGGTGIAVIFANGSDQQPVPIPLAVGELPALHAGPPRDVDRHHARHRRQPHRALWPRVSA